MASSSTISSFPRRVYPLDARELTEEQIAVAFAMTSRRPESFDEIAHQVSQEKAADFHERWVLGYGHGSVAEHAVLHLAVENISRVACDTLEDNRLASYTEKSSRYQVFPEGYYHVPAELDEYPDLKETYRQACDSLFETYQQCIDGCIDHLKGVHPQGEKERDSAYGLRLRRIATDSCRLLLPAASLTNVGVTANARVLEHAISKLMSSRLQEEAALGLELRTQSQAITPTLIKYADPLRYLTETVSAQQGFSPELDQDAAPVLGTEGSVQVTLVDWDPRAEERLTAALMYRFDGGDYYKLWNRVNCMGPEDRREIIDRATAALGPHDATLREFEQVGYTFEFSMDYGAYREFKRHRMMSYIPQEPTVSLGYRIPEVITDAGLESTYREAVAQAEEAFRRVSNQVPIAAQYLVTHAHYRRVLARMNLRECYHLFKLRTSHLAHFSIKEPMLEAMKLVVELQPQLFRNLRLRDYPDWWPFPQQ